MTLTKDAARFEVWCKTTDTYEGWPKGRTETRLSHTEHSSEAEADVALQQKITGLLARGATHIDERTLKYERDVYALDEGWVPDESVYEFSIIKREAR